MAKKTDDKSKKGKAAPAVTAPTYVIGMIMEKANARSRKDINDMMAALRAAENPIFPKRLQLYNLYDRLIMDNHVSGILDHSILAKILADGYKTVMAKDNKVDPELTDLFHKGWFIEVVRQFVYYLACGPCLVQIAPDPEQGLVASLIPRRNYVPEFGWLLADQNDTVGYQLEGSPLMDYLVVIGNNPKDLGFLAKAAPNILFKSNAQVCWSEFCEIFGIPMRIGKTNSRTKADMDRMEHNLQRMGSAAYGVFQEGENIEIKESTRTDSYKVFDMLMERSNSELSKLIIGVTMATDNGSSRSQGEVHERTLEDVVQFLKLQLTALVNDKIMPLIAKHGYATEGRLFAFNEVKDIKHLWTVTEGLLNHYEIAPEWIKDNFGVEVSKKKAPTGL